MAKNRIFFEIRDQEQGFRVSLREEENKHGEGILPECSEVIPLLQAWQTAFVETTAPLRMEETGEARVVPEEELKARQSKTSELVDNLKTCLNEWLLHGGEQWQNVREVFLQVTDPKGEDNHVIIQTDNIRFWEFPWSAWKLGETTKTEIAVGPLSKCKKETDRLPKGTRVRILVVLGAVKPNSGKDTNLDNDSVWSLIKNKIVEWKVKLKSIKVRILVALGKDINTVKDTYNGIDTDFDLQLWQAAPQAKIKVLKEPKKDELLKYLRDDNGWHIFFFAGHSSTDKDGHIGQFQINEEEPLTIDELKHHFGLAIKNGLQLAIFNSCDGVGLAKQLAQLNLPQSIVMRLPVPDKVAKMFLQLFLECFAKEGKSLYAAVYETRGLLEDEFKQYPGVGWLPMICQNPAVVAGRWKEWTQASKKFRSLLFIGTLLLILLPVIGYGLYPVVLDRLLETVGMKQVTYEYEVRSYSDRVDYKWEDMNKTEGLLSLYEGDIYKVRYTPLDDSYVYVYQWSDRGKVYDLVSKYKMERQVKGGLEKMIPPDSQGRLVLAPKGVRKICVLAFKQPNPYLDQQIVKDEIITGNSQVQYYLWDPRDYLDKNCLKENKVTFENKGPDRPSPEP
jgi:hypothetical protein